MTTDATCWLSLFLVRRHDLGAEPERCLMCAAKRAEDAAGKPGDNSPGVG